MFDRVKRWLDAARLPAPLASPHDAATAESCAAPAERCAPEELSAQALRVCAEGAAAFKCKNFALARRHLERALAMQHDLAQAHFYLGLTFRAQGDLENAADSLLLAATFKRDFAEAWMYAGAVAHRRGFHDEAREYFHTALRCRPAYIEAHLGLGEVAEDREEFDAAALHYRAAIDFDPRSALAHSKLGYVTFRGRLDDAAALAYVDKALELAPGLADAHRTRAQVLQYQGRCAEAIAACDAALRYAPDAAKTRMIKALAQLMLGQFDAGWRNHEARKDVYPIFRMRKLPYPEWDGSPLAGRRLLVYHEQGIGDEVMFASCVPELLAQGCECIVECSAKLERLFRRSFPTATVVAADQTSANISHLESLPTCDWQVAAGSLPLFLRRKWDDFPSHKGYLKADDRRVEHWRDRLAALGTGRKVGLAWQGGAEHTNRTRRSLQLGQLLPLLRVPGVHFVSLQYTECAAAIAELRSRHGIALHHWQDAIDDYDETASLVSALDHVISVQTAVIHLAGALAKPTWVLVPVTAEWRYLAQGERMPWYPSVRLFRQARGEGWEPVVGAVARELESLA